MKRTSALLLGALVASLSFAFAPTYDAKLFAEMRWRSIGPLRAGRTKSAQGIAGQPNVFYIGVCNGGIWKTTDYGRTWNPIFDDQPTGSIGALAIAPSNPNIIYAGSGEGLQRPDLSTGDGVYKSIDAGKTWTHLGLRDGQQIPQIAVDPRNADKLFVAVLGHPYGPNAERGLYRSTDGGRTFDEGPRQGRKHRRQRGPDRSHPSRHRLRRALGSAPGSLGKQRVDRPRRRHVQVHRWRHDLASAHQRHSVRRRWLHPGQHRHLAQQHQPSLRLRRHLQRSGHLPLGRRRRTLGARHHRRASRRTHRRRRSLRAHRRSQESRHRLRRQHRHLEIHRRRQDLDRLPRRPGRRRLPAHLDQSQQSRYHPERQRPGRHHYR